MSAAPEFDFMASVPQRPASVMRLRNIAARLLLKPNDFSAAAPASFAIAPVESARPQRSKLPRVRRGSVHEAGKSGTDRKRRSGRTRPGVKSKGAV